MPSLPQLQPRVELLLPLLLRKKPRQVKQQLLPNRHQLSLLQPNLHRLNPPLLSLLHLPPRHHQPRRLLRRLPLRHRDAPIRMSAGPASLPVDANITKVNRQAARRIGKPQLATQQMAIDLAM